VTCSWPKIYTLSTLGPPPPFPRRCRFWWTLLLPELRDRADPLGQTVPFFFFFFLPHLADSDANGRRSAGRSGQAEMPNCVGVSPPRQVVPGLHPRPYLYIRLNSFLELSLFSFHFRDIKTPSPLSFERGKCVGGFRVLLYYPWRVIWSLPVTHLNKSLVLTAAHHLVYALCHTERSRYQPFRPQLRWLDSAFVCVRRPKSTSWVLPSSWSGSWETCVTAFPPGRPSQDG